MLLTSPAFTCMNAPNLTLMRSPITRMRKKQAACAEQVMFNVCLVSRSSVKRVASALDAADYKRVRDKFGNQFNYAYKS